MTKPDMTKNPPLMNAAHVNVPQVDNTVEAPAVILVNPQMGENIGAAARAMFNFNLRELRIVAPRDGWPNIEAERNAAGALEHMHVRVFATLQEALSDLHYVLATTARPRDMNKPIYTPRTAVADIRKKMNSCAHTDILGKNKDAQRVQCGLVFGGERTGLHNEHLALCHGIITIPTNPDFSSLNLGQSVLLLCWEWMHAQEQAYSHKQDISPLELGDDALASLGDLEIFFNRLEVALDEGGFFKAPDLKPTMIRNIRTMLLRAGMSDQELRTFHGMLSALSGKKKPQGD